MAEQKPKEYQLVVFTIGEEEFGVDISQVREIVRLVQITYLPKAPVFIEGVVNLRGQVLAVIDLSKRIGVSSKERGENTRIIPAEAFAPAGTSLVGLAAALNHAGVQARLAEDADLRGERRAQLRHSAPAFDDSYASDSSP